MRRFFPARFSSRRLPTRLGRRTSLPLRVSWWIKAGFSHMAASSHGSTASLP